MPVMTADEATKAAALERLEAAAAARREAENIHAAALARAAEAAGEWARQPTAERRQAQEAAFTDARVKADAAAEAQRRHYLAIVAAHGGRISWPDTGEWAELQTRPTHDEYKKLAATQDQLVDVKPSEMVGMMATSVGILLKAWRVLDRDGAELPQTDAGLAACPFDRLTPIFERAMAIFRGMPTPNQ